MSEDEVPPRVRAAEERRRFRELIEASSLGTPGAAAVRKRGAWDLNVPGAEEPSDEENRLADEEIKRLLGD